MTFKEAHETGLRYKRTHEKFFGRYDVGPVPLTEALADDFEVEQKQVTITLEQLEKAYMRAGDYNVNFKMKDGSFSSALAKELGLL